MRLKLCFNGSMYDYNLSQSTNEPLMVGLAGMLLLLLLFVWLGTVMGNREEWKRRLRLYPESYKDLPESFLRFRAIFGVSQFNSDYDLYERLGLK